MSGSVQYNAGPKPPIKTVYYAGTDAIVDGAAFCYDQSATVGASDLRLDNGTLVTKPATANLEAFAGIVIPGGGATGPGFFEVYQPIKGNVVDALVGVNIVAGTTALGPVNGQYHLAAFADATLNEGLTATGMETDATLTATPATARVYLR